MATPVKKTFYYTELDAINRVAKEDDIDVNGAYFQKLFFDKHMGNDEQIQRILIRFYNDDINIKEVFMHVLDMMAYTPKYVKRGNVEFIKVIREAVGTADWYDSEDNYTDFRLDNRKTRLDVVADVLGTIVAELEGRIKIVQDMPALKDMQPWELPVQDERYAEILKNEANYGEAQIAEFKIKESKIRAAFTEDITPGRALDVIIEYWPYLWNFAFVYEAVQYCITLVKSLNDKPTIRKKMRAFFINQSAERAAINLTVERVISEGQHKAGTWQRLFAYAYGMEDMK